MNLKQPRENDLIKMASNVDELAREAAKLTFVFHKTAKGGFNNIFDLGNTIAPPNKIENWEDLITLYKDWIEKNPKNDYKLPNVNLEKENYFNLAYKMAEESLQKENGRYVNPITHKIIRVTSFVNFREAVKETIYDEINESVKNIQSLRVLKDPKEGQGWETIFKTVYQVADSKNVDVSGSFPLKNEPVEPNHTVSFNGDRSENTSLNNSQSDRQKIFLRQNFKGNVPMHVKPYDILKMRDYLRIIRRLWNLSRLHDGKEIVTFDDEKKVTNHPYFKKHQNQVHIYNRINKFQKLKKP